MKLKHVCVYYYYYYYYYVIFIQGIYDYMPENTMFLVYIYSDADILWLQFMLHVMLFPMTNVLSLYISTL